MNKLTGQSVSVDEHNGLFNPTNGTVTFFDQTVYDMVAEHIRAGTFVTFGDQFGLALIESAERERRKHQGLPSFDTYACAVVPYLSPERIRSVAKTNEASGIPLQQARPPHQVSAVRPRTPSM